MLGAQLQGACCLVPCSLPTFPYSPKRRKNSCDVLFFLLLSLHLCSILFSAESFVAFSFSVGSHCLILSMWLTQGCHLFVISIGSFSPRLYVSRCNIVVFSHRGLGVSWHCKNSFRREDGILHRLRLHARLTERFSGAISSRGMLFNSTETLKSPSHWHQNANASVLGWRSLTIAMAIALCPWVVVLDFTQVWRSCCNAHASGQTSTRPYFSMWRLKSEEWRGFYANVSGNRTLCTL